MFSPQKFIQLFVIITCLLIVGVASIQAEEEKGSQPAYPSMPGMPGMPGVPMPSTESVNYAMQKMMDPNTMTLLMTMMMNPKDVTVEAMCVTCHMGEDIARYQTYYGPMLDAMWTPFQASMNPATYTGMMGMADPMMGGMGGYGNPMGMMGPMMSPMMGMGGGMPMMGGYGNPMGQMPGGQMMDPKQYEQWFNQWTEMMKNMAPQAQSQPKQ